MPVVCLLAGISLLNFGVVGYLNRLKLHLGFLSLAAAAAGALLILIGLLWLLYRKTKSEGVRRSIGGLGKAGLGLLALFVLSFAVIEAVVVFGVKNTSEEELRGADYAILLGAGLDGSVPTPAYADRLEAALGLLRDNERLVMVLTGGQGQGEDITEAEAAFRYLTERGIPAGRLVKEERSTDTAENFKNAKELLPDMERAVIVTSDFHSFRAAALAKRYGVEPLSLPVKTKGMLVGANNYLREYASMLLFLVECTGVTVDTSFLGV